MGQPFKISLNLSQIGEIAKAGHSAIKRAGKDNNAYISLNIWENDVPDKYGNHFAVTLDSTKAGRDAGEKKVYVGNGKRKGQEGSGNAYTQRSTDPVSHQAEQEQRGYPGGLPRAGEAGSAEDLPF